MRKIMIKDWSWCSADGPASSFKVDFFLGHPVAMWKVGDIKIESVAGRNFFFWQWNFVKNGKFLLFGLQLEERDIVVGHKM